MNTKVVCLVLLCCVVTFCTAQTSQGIRFVSGPRNDSTVHAPALLCNRNGNGGGTGILISYESLQKALIERDRIESALRVLAPKSILLITSSNIVEGTLLPYHTFTRDNNLVGNLINSWGFQGVILRNVVARDAGQTDVAYNSREWCYNMNITWVETGYYDGIELERLADSTMNLSLSIVANQSFVSPQLHIVTIKAGDVNRWFAASRSGGMIFWRIFFTLLAGITSSIALYKLIVYVRVIGVELSVPQLALVLLFLGSLYRCGYVATDPIYMHYANTYGYQSHMLASIHWPINVLTTLLLALYWKEVMDSTKVQASGFLSKMRIPFFIASAIIVIAEIAVSVCRAIEVAVQLATLVAGVLYLILMGSTSIFFISMGIKITLRLRKSASSANVKSSSRSQRTLRRTTLFVMATAFFGFFFIAGVVQAIMLDWFGTVTGWIVTWTTVYFGLFAGALVQVLTVRTPDASLQATPSASRSAGSNHPSGPKGGSNSTNSTSQSNA